MGMEWQRREEKEWEGRVWSQIESKKKGSRRSYRKRTGKSKLIKRRRGIRVQKQGEIGDIMSRVFRRT
jgi:hypothetical protein